MNTVPVYIGPVPSGVFNRAVENGGGNVVATPDSAEAIVWRSNDADALQAVLHPRVRWVQLVSVAVEDWLASGLIGGPVTYTSAGGWFGAAVAEHALALVLACSRRLGYCGRATEWAPDVASGFVLSESTITGPRLRRHRPQPSAPPWPVRVSYGGAEFVQGAQ